MPPKKNIKKIKKTAGAAKKTVKKEVASSPKETPAIVPPTPMPQVLPVKMREGYIETIGRRKTSIARVRIKEAPSFSININERTLENYFPTFELREIIEAPFKRSGLAPKFDISVRVNGGGIHSQAEAVRHGISRALEEREPAIRKILKPLGFLKRDPRAKERRKFGLKKARKAPQWAKR